MIIAFFSKENYHKTVTFQYSMEKDGPTFLGGSNFSQGEGSNCIFLYKPIEFVISRGLGSGPLPPPLDPLVTSLTGFVHTSSWPKDIQCSMTLTPLMQVLCGWGKQRQCPTRPIQ